MTRLGSIATLAQLRWRMWMKGDRMMNLDDLGTRICILGPSNSGKSTLAAVIGQVQHLPVVHLDQLRHVPGTQWALRPDDEFACLHDAAIGEKRWVIEGNYSKLLPSRLERATGLLLLDSSAAASLLRYVRRTLTAHNRVGGLDGTRDRMSWDMIRFILGPAQLGRRRNRHVFDSAHLPKIFIHDRNALKLFYSQQNLSWIG